MKRPALAICVVLAMAVSRVQADVTMLQNGVAPAADYAGCKDAWISGEQWEGGNQGKAATLAAGGKRAILMQFDLAAVPKGDTVHKAVLRLAEAGMPRAVKEGKCSSLMAHRLTHVWTESAGWKEFDRPQAAKGETRPPANWAAAGGDFDSETDFGQPTKGLIALDTMLTGAFGHIRELDVTPIVKAWLAGKHPNQGLLITSNGLATIASAEWHVPAYRPALLIDHGPPGSLPAGIPAINGQTPGKLDLDEISATPDDAAARGDYTTVRVGQNESAALRGKSTDAYVKEAVLKYPGNWGWALQCRVGGVAGDFSRTLLYFDLSELPPKASIKSARLCVFYYQPGRETRGVRFGAYRVKLPDVSRGAGFQPASLSAPGWVDSEVTFAEARQGVRWPKGGVVAATCDKPAAVATVLRGEIEEHGRKGQGAVGLEFDLTGLVRAWASGKAPNCGVLLDNRIEGGSCDIHSSRSWQFDKRPYLEITLSPGVDKRPAPIADKPAPPSGDYWVQSMREVHQRFQGRPGTLSQYGDSITITGAYLMNFAWGKKITGVVKNMTPEVKAEMEAVEKYAEMNLFREWKGPAYGNDGSTTSAWLLSNVDRWQKAMNAEAATIMFGTNDLGGLDPPQYCENLAGSCLRMVQDGTVPMLNSVPPAAGREKQAREAWLQVCSVCRGLKVPLIDYYGEALRRRPDDWNGAGPQFKGTFGKDVYAVETIISADGTHPSNPAKYANDFSAEALDRNGYTLRNYTTLRMYYQVMSKVFRSGPPGGRGSRPSARSRP
jgi:hypothetical protein